MSSARNDTNNSIDPSAPAGQRARPGKFKRLAERSLAWWIALGMTLAILPLATSSVLLHLYQDRRALAAFDDVAARYRTQTVPMSILETALWKTADAVEGYVDAQDPEHALAFRDGQRRVNAAFAQLGTALVDDPRLASLVRSAEAEWSVAAQRTADLIARGRPPADPGATRVVEDLDDDIERSAESLATARESVAADLAADHERASKAYARGGWIATCAAVLSLLFIVAGIAVIVRMLRISVDRLVTGARKFSAGDRDHRIDVSVPPELRDIAAELNKMIVQIRDAEHALADQARRDVLTGLRNRRAFDEALAMAFARLRRMREPVVLITVDIDHFKKSNDTYGHGAGDAVLAAVGRTLDSTVREVDTVFRVGGEEFAILLSGSDQDGARIAAERLREAIAAKPIAVDGAALPVSASLGVAIASGVDGTPDSLVQSADRALYAAKSAGRNRVVVAAPDEQVTGS